MNLTPELLGTGAVGAVVILGAVGNYLLSLRRAPRSMDSVLTGIGLAFGDKEQSERVISALVRIAAAVESMADRDRADMKQMLEDLGEEVRGRPRRRP